MKRLLGISGRKASGKSTLAQYLLANSPRLFPGRTVRVIGFADSMKEVVHAILGIPREILWGDDSVKGVPVPGKTYSARKVLQTVPEAFRQFEPDCWMQRALATAERLGSDLTIIPDVRFPNEVEAIRERGGIVIRLTRDPHYGADRHVTETALDCYTFDAVIDNKELTKVETQQRALQVLTRLWGWPIFKGD